MYYDKRINDPSPRQKRSLILRWKNMKRRQYRRGKLAMLKDQRSLAGAIFDDAVSSRVQEWVYVAELDQRVEIHDAIRGSDLEAERKFAEAIFQNRFVRRKIIDPMRVSYTVRVLNA